MLETTIQVLLERNLDPVPRFRFLRDVIRIPPESTEYIKAHSQMLASKWIYELKNEQYPDGSWGRFHTQDTSLKAKFPTTESAIDRALALGLDDQNEILQRTGEYIIKVLQGKLRITDHIEKTSLWYIGIRLILTSYLAKIDPDSEIAVDEWTKWSRLIEKTLIEKKYDPDYAGSQYTWSPDRQEERISVLLKTKYALGLLGIYSNRLSPELDDSIVKWAVELPRGIAYLETPLRTRQFSPGSLDRWLTSIELLSSFRSWEKYLREELELIRNWMNKEGRWDFGVFKTRSINYPLSENWRRKGKREEDYSVRILSILSRSHL